MSTKAGAIHFRVESHWHEKGKTGFIVWRYRLLRMEASTLAAETVQGDPEPSHVLSGGNALPGRVTTTVQRIVRDTKQSKKVKNHHGFACQVCGLAIKTAGGSYAEAAHIKPLGAPHNGPDVPSNIICLCPNHHVMFDLGAFAIADNLALIGLSGVLSVKKGHDVDAEYIRYHREHYLQKVESSK